MTQNERGTQAVQRALQVLQCFSVEEPQLALTEIAKRAGLTVPTAHRIIKALQSHQFVVQDSDNGHYGLGSGVMRLARVILHRDNQERLINLATPHLRRLREETGETAAVHVLTERERLCVAEVPSHHPIRMANGVGCMYPLYAGAAGKVILTHLDDTLVDEVLEDVDKAKLVFPFNERHLRRELARIRERGYAISLGETVPSASAVAAPVFSASGAVVAAMSLAGPVARWTQDEMETYVGSLVEATRTLSEQLGSTVGSPESAVST